MLDSRPKGRGFEPHNRHCVVSLSKNINPSLVLVQPRKIRPFITERLLMGRKESNQTNTNYIWCALDLHHICIMLMKLISLQCTSQYNHLKIIFIARQYSHGSELKVCSHSMNLGKFLGGGGGAGSKEVDRIPNLAAVLICLDLFLLNEFSE